MRATVPFARPLDRGRPAQRSAGHLRATTRAVGLVGTSLLAGALLFPLARSARARHALLRAWARSSARIVGMRVRVEGAPPPAGSLLVANHLGYLDVVTFWCALSATCVAKSEVAGWPLVGALGRLAGTLFIDRSRRCDVERVIPAIEHALRRGERVLLFAEATSTRGDRVLPFRSALFEAAVRSERPVACASVHYATPAGAAPAERSVCWWGDMTFLDHVYALLRLPRIEATLRFAEEPLVGTDRKALARRAQAVVESIWMPVPGAR